jgi:hypothetical protein
MRKGILKALGAIGIEILIAFIAFMWYSFLAICSMPFFVAKGLGKGIQWTFHHPDIK